MHNCSLSSCLLLFPKDIPQSFFFLLSSENHIHSSSDKSTNLGPAELEMLDNERVLIGKGAPKDAHVVGLHTLACLLACSKHNNRGISNCCS